MFALEDKAKVKGFICETAGAEGAEDIGALGGWRSFIASESAVAKTG
jgi:allophanate hydrolase